MMSTGLDLGLLQISLQYQNYYKKQKQEAVFTISETKVDQQMQDF